MSSQTVDVLALAAHPDDVELCAGGTMCTLSQQGYTTAVVDFTRGEMGSRGTPEQRAAEAEAAARIMGLADRDNLGLPDGNIENTPATRRRLIQRIRRYRPDIVLINAPECRHPDHCAAAELAQDALYYSGLRKIETTDAEGSAQEPWRPHHILHYMQAVPFEPTFVLDVSDVWAQRIEALQAFESQFYNPDYEPDPDEPETYISNPAFFKWVEARARTYGYRIGATYGEPLLYYQGPVGLRDLPKALSIERPFR